jgi:hypothetical protein
MVEILETGILHKSIDNTIYKICKEKKSPQQGVKAQRQRQRWGAAEKAIAKTDVGSREGNSTERWGTSEKGIAEICRRQRRELQREMGTAEEGIAERDGGGGGEGDNGDGDGCFFLQSKCQQEQG